MPLVKSVLKTQLKSLFNQMSEEKEREAAIEKLTENLATIIDSYIKTATVTISPGQGVQVAPLTGTGSTITPGTGTLS